jgi:hypothetical protein
MIYSLNRTTCFGQGRPSSGHQEPGYALYNSQGRQSSDHQEPGYALYNICYITNNGALDDLKMVYLDRNM